MLKVTFDGFDELNRKLERLGDNAKSIHGDHQVPLNELFPATFMLQHSKLQSFDSLLRAGGFEDTPFAEIPDAEWDRVVAAHTVFADWSAMKEAAARAWARERVMRGV